MTAAYFTITGKALTRIARDLMLDDEPGQAWRLLADGLIGDGAADAVRKVLAGDADLIGDSVNGVGVVDRGESDFDAETADKYIKRVRYVYAGRFRHQGRWFRPRAVVTALGPEDAMAAGPCPSMRGMVEWSKRRAAFYGMPGDLVEVCRVSLDLGDGHDPANCHVIFEPCGELPQWWKPAITAQAALDGWIAERNSLEPVGATYCIDREDPSPSIWLRPRPQPTEQELQEQDARYAAQDAARDAEAKSIGDRVRDLAGSDTIDLTLLDGRVVKVPRAPFVHWAFRQAPKKPDNMPPWTPVASSGWKMTMDDPNHTDWMLGAGLPLSDAYEDNVRRPAYDLVIEMQCAEVDRAD